MDAYTNREQTKAKHYILRHYLQALAFKVLRNWDIAYVDGFSGPWESKTPDFSDTSFMIAIGVLKEAQRVVREQTKRAPKIRCFFSEKDPAAFREMVDAVAPFHQPDEGFEIRTYQGEFVDAVAEIRTFVGKFFPLIFIDPTGWTEYPLTKIDSLFHPAKVEVLINFMYGHISRFISHPDEKIIASLDPILGGPDWKDRLDLSLKPGPAVEKLFRETLKAAGNFAYVISTRIDKSTEDRPHFFLAYGTKDRNGLKAFRETEFEALKEHARNRSAAKTRKRETRTGSGELFADFDADLEEASIESIVAEQKALAKERLVQMLKEDGTIRFTKAIDVLLEAFMVRETNVKDICVELAKDGQIRNTWGSGNRKPTDDTVIQSNSSRQ
jgi:three-Cys-motif partner protein